MTFWGEPNAAVNHVGPLFLNSYHRIWYLFCVPKTLWLMLAIGPTGRLAFFYSAHLLCSLYLALFALLHFLRGLANQTSLQWWSSRGLSRKSDCHRLSWCAGLIRMWRSHVTLAIPGSNAKWPRGVFDLCDGQLGISWTTQWNTSCLAPVRIMSHSHLKLKGFEVGLRRIPPQRGPEDVSFEAFFNRQFKCEIIHTWRHGLGEV